MRYYVILPKFLPQPQPQPAEPKVINTQKPRMEPLAADDRLSQEQKENLDLIMGVSLEVAVEIGRTRRKIQDIIAFSKGSLVVLDKLAGEPVDLLVNGQCARCTSPRRQRRPRPRAGRYNPPCSVRP